MKSSFIIFYEKDKVFKWIFKGRSELILWLISTNIIYNSQRDVERSFLIFRKQNKIKYPKFFRNPIIDTFKWIKSKS